MTLLLCDRLERFHLAEGNGAEARRQYGLFRRLLREQLGVDPAPQIEQLVVGVRA